MLNTKIVFAYAVEHGVLLLGSYSIDIALAALGVSTPLRKVIYAANALAAIGVFKKTYDESKTPETAELPRNNLSYV